MSEPTSAEGAQDLTFEQALQRLEQIVETLEQDPPDLEAALLAYEEGVQLTRYCLDRLNTAEMRIQELKLE